MAKSFETGKTGSVSKGSRCQECRYNLQKSFKAKGVRDPCNSYWYVHMSEQGFNCHADASPEVTRILGNGTADPSFKGR
jgi:hypothetical protein